MAQCKISNVAFRGLVCAVPGEPRKIEEFGAAFDPQEIEKIKNTVGLRQLYRVRDGQTAGDLCAAAAKTLLSDLGWDPKSIDGVIMVTQYPDYFCPATACVIHGKLGLSANSFAYDVNLGCSGYVYGLSIAAQSIASGCAKRILFLAGDTPSLTVSPEDKSVTMLFGDAGTATALEFDPNAGPMSFVLGTDGTGSKNLIVPGGAFRSRPKPESFVRSKGEDGNIRSPMDLFMDGLEIFNFTLQRVPTVVSQTLELHGWVKEQVDAFVMHQANAFLLKTLMKKMKLPVERIPINIGKYGNTSLSSIPLLLADDLSEEICGDRPRNLALVAFGIGYSWGAVTTTLSHVQIAKVINTEMINYV